MQADFDFLIVGSGTAGSLLARGLTNSHRGTVALLEAGTTQRDVRTVVPNWYPRAFASRLDWGYRTQSQPGLANRVLAWPRGKLLGGSSAINALIYLQTSDADFQRWGWGWARHLQSQMNWPHEPICSPHPWASAFVDAFESLGFERARPLQVALPNTCGLFALSQSQGRRVHPGQGIEQSHHLSLKADTHATRIAIENGRAIGAYVTCGGEEERLITAGRTILCAGAIGSPLLLMRSGIGEAKDLREAGVECLVELPSVGRNLQDHLVMPLVYRAHDPIGLPRRHGRESRQLYRQTGSGALASNIAEAGAFVANGSDSQQSLAQIHFTATHYLKYPNLRTDNDHFSLAINDPHPASRGSVRLPRLDSRGEPLIDPAYLSHSSDLPRMLEAVERVRELVANSSLSRIAVEEALPGERRTDQKSIARSIRSMALSIYHPVGTCRMQLPGETHSLSETSFVVDQKFQVIGVEGLHVVDASVLPDLPAANPNATVMLLAMRALELML